MLCLEFSIKLIRIPYWDFDNIEEILNRELGWDSGKKTKSRRKA